MTTKTSNEQTLEELSSVRKTLQDVTKQMMDCIEGRPRLSSETINALRQYHHQLQVVESNLASAISRLEDAIDLSIPRQSI
jgi:hypothetical protein